MPPRPKHLCACGCALYVTRKVEVGHLNGQRSALLAADVLSQNRSVIRSHKKASRFRTLSPSRHLGKQKLLGRRAPAQLEQALSSENPSNASEFEFEPADFPMGDSEAGPSRSQHPASPQAFTINLNDDSASLSAQHSLTPRQQDSATTPLVPGADSDDPGLSTQRRSRRLTARIEKIGRVRWGTNQVQFIEREEREEEENSIIPEDVEDDGIVHDEDEDGLEDEDDMPFAEPGQEGISVWDVLGEGFLIEAANLG